MHIFREFYVIERRPAQRGFHRVRSGLKCLWRWSQHHHHPARSKGYYGQEVCDERKHLQERNLPEPELWSKICSLVQGKVAHFLKGSNRRMKLRRRLLKDQINPFRFPTTKFSTIKLKHKTTNHFRQRSRKPISKEDRQCKTNVQMFWGAIL